MNTDIQNDLERQNVLANAYDRLVLSRPLYTLALFAILLLLLSQYVENFSLDASSDSLVLENDNDLHYYQKVVTKYGSSDYLVLTYSPKSELFSDATLDDIGKLRDGLLSLPEIDSIVSILDVPLMQSPPQTLAEVNSQTHYLLDLKTDRVLAKKEFLSSPIYKDLLVSDDLSTTALIISLKADNKLRHLYRQRNELKNLSRQADFTVAQSERLSNISAAHQRLQREFQARQSKLISQVRVLITKHSAVADLFLGGIPMIVTDSIGYIKKDLLVFGALALAVIVLILALAFNQLVWVVVPLLTCLLTGFVMVCLLGLLNWPVSVVSSNFLSLLMIITLSLNIHLIVRYRELFELDPSMSSDELLKRTMHSKFIPCLYTSITTTVAFASLLVSGIRPVIDFGWMMCIGITLALLISFSFFPALVSLLKPSVRNRGPEVTQGILVLFSKALDASATKILLSFLAVVVIGSIGLTQLTVENRFIDYFKANTEIYQGMHLIDQKLGGTTPLDIIIDAPEFSDLAATEHGVPPEPGHAYGSKLVTKLPQHGSEFRSENPVNDLDSFDDLFDEFEDETADDKANSLTNGYWYNEQGIHRLSKIQTALEAFEETGKVTSLASTFNTFEGLKDAKRLDNIDLAFLNQVISEENRALLIDPYLSDDGNQTHINIRVFESDKNLDRNQLISDVEQLLLNDFGLKPSQVHLSGMLVLYNNMLNSLFESQIMTLGVVFLSILMMFMVLFRNIKLAMLAIVPNLFSAVFVLGLMGLLSIPLDLMTITIAAISVGIAVDDTIHYVHRFQQEYRLSGDYQQALRISAMSIGKAMYYTTLVIAIGFLILVFSNFVPTMYFGLLTGVAMVSALIGDLVLMPVLIRKFRPLS
ncbi:MAG: putative RND superfamily exporter protein [Arenicella sp.]|jgi:predicted RND superfamily exporter protein